MEKVGIKETKEAALGLISLATELAKAFKAANADGEIGAHDLPVALGLLLSPEFISQIQEALDGIDQISAEIEDLDLAEGIELMKDIGMAALESVKELKGA